MYLNNTRTPNTRVDQTFTVMDGRDGRGANPFDGVDVGDGAAPFCADFDGDGKKDCVIGRAQGNLTFYKNTGSTRVPAFQEKTGPDNPFNSYTVGSSRPEPKDQSFSCPFCADFDEDGDLDCIIGLNQGEVRYLQNIGSSTAPEYAELTGTKNPFNGIDVGNQAVPTCAAFTGMPALGCAFGNSAGTVKYAFNVEYSKGNAGRFELKTSTNNPFSSVNVFDPSAPACADFDGLGILDCVVLAEGNSRRSFYKNVGTNTSPNLHERGLAQNPFFGIDVGHNSVPFCADFTGDGLVDCIIGARDGDQITFLKNMGTALAPRLVAQTDSANPFTNKNLGPDAAPFCADFDGSGSPLSCIIGMGNGMIKFLKNTGNKTNPEFEERTGSDNPFDGVDVGGTAVPFCADFEGAGTMNCGFGNSAGNVTYFRMTGCTSGGGPCPAFTQLSWTDANNPFGVSVSLNFPHGIYVGAYSAPFCADFFGTGVNGCAIGRNDGMIEYFANEGGPNSTKFYSLSISEEGNPFKGVDVGMRATPFCVDFDGDGDMDCAIGAGDGTIKYLRNYGTESYCYYRGAFADVDLRCLCSDGYSGAQCFTECPADTSTTTKAVCNGKGACYSSGESEGTCLCQKGFGGLGCDDCIVSTTGASYFGNGTSNQNLQCTVCPGDGTCKGHGACASGKAGNGTCTCSAGWAHSSDGSCNAQLPCAPGYGVPYPGADRCDICINGKFSTGTTGACQNCARGSYADSTGMSACTQCPALSKRLSDGEGINAVKCVCQAEYFMKCSKGQATACLNDSPQVPSDYFCQKCPKGSDCASGGTLKAAPGSYQSPATVGSVEAEIKLAGLPTSLATEPALTPFKASFSTVMALVVEAVAGSVAVTGVTLASPTIDVSFTVSIPAGSSYTSATINSRIAAFASSRRVINFFAQLSGSLSNASLVSSGTSISSSGFTTVKIAEPKFAGTSIYICPYPKNCQGVNGSMCALGAEGALCGICSEGYALKENGCEKCAESATGNYMTLIVLAVVLVVILVCVYGAYMATEATEEAGCDEEQATNTVIAASKVAGTNVEMATFGEESPAAPGSRRPVAEATLHHPNAVVDEEDDQEAVDEIQGNIEEAQEAVDEIQGNIEEAGELNCIIDSMLDVEASDATAFHGGPTFDKSDRQKKSELVGIARKLGIDGGSIDSVTGKASEAAQTMKADASIKTATEVLETLKNFLSTAASALGTPLKIVIGNPPSLFLRLQHPRAH